MTLTLAFSLFAGCAVAPQFPFNDERLRGFTNEFLFDIAMSNSPNAADQEVARRAKIIFCERTGVSSEVVGWITRGRYWTGMSSNLAKLSLGLPTAINRDVGQFGTVEQWIYRNSSPRPIYLYFRDGILTSFQDSPAP